MAGPRPTPDVAAILLDSYLNYKRRVEHDVGEYLAHFGGLWEEVHQYSGVTHYDGMVRAIVHLPRDWQCWAWTLIQSYTTYYYPYYDIVADFRGFLSALQHRYTLYRRPPDGPYQFPLRLSAEAEPFFRPLVQSQQSEAPTATEDPVPPTSVLGRRGREDFEAGASVAHYRCAPSAPTIFTAHTDEGGPSTVDRGKAPMVDVSQEKEIPRPPSPHLPGPEASTEELHRTVAKLPHSTTPASLPAAHRDWPAGTGPSSSSSDVSRMLSDHEKWMTETRQRIEENSRAMAAVEHRLEDFAQRVEEWVNAPKLEPQPALEPKEKEDPEEEDPEEEEGLPVDLEDDPDSDED